MPLVPNFVQIIISNIKYSLDKKSFQSHFKIRDQINFNNYISTADNKTKLLKLYNVKDNKKLYWQCVQNHQRFIKNDL